MKSTATLTTLAIAFLLCAASGVHAQGSARGRLDAARDPIAETNAKHSLDVARWYLTKRKAYGGARDRLQEIVDIYPEFSRMDEVFYLLGEANYKLDENEKASEQYEKLLKQFPGSEFAKKARERLKELKPST
jgi:outer membrane protein assembly factor BamD (BamD/ComL family)